MKILLPLILACAIGVLGVGTFSFVHSASAEHAPEQPMTAMRPSPTPPPNALAEPLLHRVFTSDCQQDKSGFFRESLEFSGDGTTRFSRRFFVDAQCQESKADSSVREGRYELIPDEGGRLLLMVRHLQGQTAEESTPYFEALISIDHDHLVMENGVSSSLQYTAQTLPI